MKQTKQPLARILATALAIGLMSATMAYALPAASPDLTEGELAAIAQYPHLTVSIDNNRHPLQSIDADTGEANGVSVALLKAIGGKCGIQFDFVANELGVQTDMSAVIVGDISPAFHPGITLPYHEVPLVFVGPSSKDPQGSIQVGVSKMRGITPAQITATYPNLQISVYDTVAGVSDALDKKDIDLGLVTLYSFEGIIHRNHSQLSAYPSSLNLILELQLGEHLPAELATALDKSIHQLTPAEITALVFANSTAAAVEPTFNEFLWDNAPALVLAALLILLALLALVILLIVTSNSKRRVLQNTAKSLQDAAYLDNMTGCYTMLGFRTEALKRLKAAKAGEYTLAALDVDNFKYINDVLGYETGNRVLQLLVQIFTGLMQPSTLLARQTADNFFFLYPTAGHHTDVCNDANAQHLANSLSALLGNNFSVRFSVGVYQVDDPTLPFSFMLDCAGIAKKTIKGLYDHAIANYTKQMDSKLRIRREIILAMEQALENEEFEAYLQPKYLLQDDKNERLCGAEVLVRWISPRKGIIQPMAFIPIFENNGFISKLDLYMFEHTCALIHRWKEIGIPDIPRISVNLSVVTAATPSIVQSLQDTAARHGIDTSCLEVELTESALSRNPAQTLAVMSSLKNAGFWVSIDDFGSGYSSLHLLKDVSADVLKIDKGFLGETMNTEKGQAVIRSIISMSKKLQLETVAEGVETEAQATDLWEMGCDMIQGFFFARPMPIKEFEVLLEENEATVTE